jgi:cobaltochelatase CobN
MHRIATIPGGWDPDREGVILVDQTPAPLVVLTAADTEIQTLATAIQTLPTGFPAIRAVNLLQLQQQLSIDTYAETVLEQAQVIVLRLLGGQAYWAYGLEVVEDTVRRRGTSLLVLPGDDQPDPQFMGRSTVPLTVVNQVWRYWAEGGVVNVANALRYAANTCLGGQYPLAAPQPVPRVGCYHGPWVASASDAIGRVGLLFYRAHYLAGNLAPIDALALALIQRGLDPVALYVSSLRDPEVQRSVLQELHPKDDPGLDLILNTTSFSVGTPLPLNRAPEPAQDAPQLWQTLNVPVLQAVLGSSTQEQWQTSARGLSPRDTAMNVALPEVDGRILTRAVSFKAAQQWDARLQTEVVRYVTLPDRVEVVADLAYHWVRLRHTPASERRVALILANYPTRDGRLANGVGLDTPASCVAILKTLHQAGYRVSPMPTSGDELIQWLTQGITNDPEGQELRPVRQWLSWQDYQAYFQTLPSAVQAQMQQRWPLTAEVGAEAATADWPIAGQQFGHVFVGIQPARGYDQDPSLNYHAPDLEPTHAYLAFYQWIRQVFGAHAIVHVGKHGNLEWLPGKSLALSQDCYPEVACGPLPHLYPFIVNDPGEGAQAKRRTQAVILDHLTPPMTRAELYGSLQQLEHLVDEYYEAVSLDPARLSPLRTKILHLLRQEHLDQDFGLSQLPSAQDPQFEEQVLNHLDRCLCDLKEAQIRDGLHILGQCPRGTALRDLVVAIARFPQAGRQGLTRAIATDLQLDLDPLTSDPAQAVRPPAHLQELARDWRHVGDAIAGIEALAAAWVTDLIAGREWGCDGGEIAPGPHTQAELTWIRQTLLPALGQTAQELQQLLRGLNGEYVPSGPSGAPTRGRPEVLPTGRNFYAVDLRSLPTETAWDLGRKAAEALIERYTQDQGEYPQTLGLSLWGTATMRTGGDDLAEALALLGVQPVWEGASRRVVDFEILPLAVLGRPRVDVTLRISGFFRDAFPNLIDLFDQAVTAVAALDEPAEQNPLAAHVRQETTLWQAQGLAPEQALTRARYRIFGSKPGAYGAGLQGLIEAQNWSSDADLARAYINWSSYAYSGSGVGGSGVDGSGAGHAAPESLAARLQQMQIVLHNQDNREHDLLDSDDYYQFQGGLAVAVRSLQGQQPTIYFGDHALPERPRIRSLSEELAKVYRSRVINPKWIAGVMRHGYKGAFEMAATVDYLFAYDATTHCVADHMYQGIAEAYLINPQVQAFLHEKNPWALRDMAERLLEARQRGLWQGADASTLEQLRAIALEAEGQIEGRASP